MENGVIGNNVSVDLGYYTQESTVGYLATGYCCNSDDGCNFVTERSTTLYQTSKCVKKLLFGYKSG